MNEVVTIGFASTGGGSNTNRQQQRNPLPSFMLTYVGFRPSREFPNELLTNI